MEIIKKYFKAWDLSRIVRMGIGVSLMLGYFSTKESIYIMGGLIFMVQAVLNIGCPGGTCTTNTPAEKDKQVMKFDKYEPNKEKTNV
jgi:hypothetical protein